MQPSKKTPMPASPLLDERVMMDALRAPIAGGEGASRIMIGAMWALLDSFDRKLERDKFEEIADQSVKLTQLLARLSLCEIIQRMHNNGTLTGEKLEEAVADLAKRAEVERRSFCEKMNLVVQCPWESDPIN